LTLALAVVVLVAPGLAMMLALGITRPVWWIGLSAPATIGVATLTASACAVVGLSYGPAPLALVTVVLAAVGVVRLVRSGRLRLESPSGWWTSLVASARPHLDLVPGWLLVGVGIAIGTLTWMRGMGSLATILQEHDMISHGFITSYIQRTGNAAPWQLMPIDVLTEDHVSFYPSGMHLIMAVVADLRGGTVAGVNAVSVAALAVGWTSGSATLGYVAARLAKLDGAAALLVAGITAILAAGLYRPAISLVEWGGILANAITLSLTPGLLAVLVTLPKRGWSHAAAAGVGCAGMFAVHSSAGVTVGVSLVAWSLGEALLADGRRLLKDQLLPLAVVGGVAAVAASPAIGPLLDVADNVSGFQPDISAISLRDAVARTVGLAYNNGDPNVDIGVYQLAAGLICAFGAAVVALTRRGLGILSAWLVWVAIVVAAWVRPGKFPQSLVTNGFYDAQTRVWAHVSLFVAPVAGLGVVLAATVAAGGLARLAPSWRERRAWLVLGLGVIGAMAYVAGPGRGYAQTNQESVAARYKTPDVVLRFSEDDRRAGEYLATRVTDGERVLNSANDGSTLLYVEHGLPIVNVLARGSALEPATYKLMSRFNTYPDSPDIREMLRDLNVRWVVVDSNAPRIAANGAPEAWIDWLDVAPGLTHLDGLPGLDLAYKSGTVSVYSLDLRQI
jgi:hypothetical protein